MDMNRRDFSKMVIAAVGGIVAGGSLVGCSGDADKKQATKEHVCKGMNACQNAGNCQSGDAKCAGKNSCEKKGGCAAESMKHACAKKNSCHGKGGCSTGDAGCAGKNSCDKKGGCKVPVMKH